MITKLLKLDPAVRAIPACVAGAVAITLIHELTVGRTIRGLDFLDAELATTEHSYVGQMAVVMMLFVMIVNGIRIRVTELQATQPVPPRTWILARIVALCSLGWAVFAATTLTAIIAIDSESAQATLIRESGALALAWTAWVVGCFAVQPRLPLLTSVPKLVGVHFAFLCLVGVSLAQPAAGSAIAAVTIAGALTALLRRCPDRMSFEDVSFACSTDAATEATGAANVAEELGVLRRRTWRTWVARRTVLRLPVLVLCIFMAFLVTLIWASDTSTMTFAVLMPMWLAAVLGHSTQVLREVGHLPIPRRRLAPWVLLPGLVSLVVGVLAATAVQALDRTPGMHEEVDLISFNPKEPSKHQTVRVPNHLLRLAWDDASLRVQSPHGEVAELRPTELIPGLPVVLVNPYGFGPENSRAFVAWQLSRAVRDAYGIAVEPAVIDEAYLSVLDGRVIGPFFSQRFLDDYGEQELTRPAALPFVGLLCALLFWGLSGAVVLRRNVPPASERAWRRHRFLTTTTLLVLLALLATSIGLPILLRLSDGAYQPDLRHVLAGMLAASPLGSPALLGLLVATATLGTYLLLERRFARLEVPPPLPKVWEQQRGLSPGLGRFSPSS